MSISEGSDTQLVTPHIRRLLNYYDPLSPTYMQTPPEDVESGGES